MKIMIVDDHRTYLAILHGIIARLDSTDVRDFSDPYDALRAAAAEEFDLILVDFMMPKMDGVEFIERLRRIPSCREQPVVMITADDARETRLHALEAGATEFLKKPVEPIELRVRINNLLALRQAQLKLRNQAILLERAVKDATKELEASERDVVTRLARAIDCRDGDTGDHVSRMAELCRLIGEGLGFDEHDCEMIRAAAPLHDVGKIGVPDAVLQKPGRLEPAEMAIMKEHVSIGESILEDSRSPLLKTAAIIASSHHERWDGSGYPRGLSADQIPVMGRVAAVADVFEALTADRIYRPAWSLEKARQFIRDGAGTQFDPACVRAFEAQWDAIVDVIRPGIGIKASAA
nr:HD domain-containing phosphohydrolase [Methylobacterium sp. ZNC0032]